MPLKKPLFLLPRVHLMQLDRRIQVVTALCALAFCIIYVRVLLLVVQRYPAWMGGVLGPNKARRMWPMIEGLVATPLLLLGVYIVRKLRHAKQK